MIMEVTLLSANPILPDRRFWTNRRSSRNGLMITKRFSVKSCQGETDHNQQGKPVDENMIVLKMRIKKMKVLETTSSNEGAPPSKDWKEWEKRIFKHYHEGVFDSVELLQSYLMNTRPSIALGILALVAMSVPLSSSVVMANVLKVARGLLAGCHVCIDIDF